jgi:hypothetical protein
MQRRGRGQQPGALRETAGVDSKTTQQLQRVGHLGPQPGAGDLGETRVCLLFGGDAVEPVQPGQEHAARPGQRRAELLAPAQRPFGSGPGLGAVTGAQGEGGAQQDHPGAIGRIVASEQEFAKGAQCRRRVIYVGGDQPEHVEHRRTRLAQGPPGTVHAVGDRMQLSHVAPRQLHQCPA